jgi:small-conductance mechanosensitive channel
MIQISRVLAIILGIITPIAETIRRWHTWQDNPPALFDDYLLGGFLLFGAWRVGKDLRSGQRFLAAGWAFMCGMAYGSFFEQVHRYRLGIVDPAPISSFWVAVIKGVGFALAIIALLITLRPLPAEET